MRAAGADSPLRNARQLAVAVMVAVFLQTILLQSPHVCPSACARRGLGDQSQTQDEVAGLDLVSDQITDLQSGGA